MDYKEIKNEIINKYQKERGIDKGDKIYLLSIKRRDIWGNLENLKGGDIEDVILEFLNKWQCRIKVTPGLINNLQQTLKELSKYFISVKDEKLESFDFDKSIKINGETFNTEDAIIKIFNNLCYIRAGRRDFGATATSKVMHMVNPDFFMMFDDKIREHYGCFANANGYVNFIWRMQKLGKEIIKSYSVEFGINEATAKEKVCEMFCNNWVIPKEWTALPKLIDEFNYSRYTLNL